MREIKFRAIPENRYHEDIDSVLDSIAYYTKGEGFDDTFVYGYLNGDYILGPRTKRTKEYYAPSYWVKIDKATIGQYTGLKDKNGREIYVGDIVLVADSERSGTFKIEKVKSLWGYEFHWKPILGYPCSTHILERDYSNCHVVGNIYENPELLEEGYDATKN